MVRKIIWTEHASDDLAAVVRYVAHDNPEAARRLGYALYDQVQVLAQFPELGRVVREFGDPDWRQLTHRPYRIIYHLNADQQTVEIVRIWHGARGDVELPA